MQFNLKNEEVECAQREVELWRRDPSCPMIIEVGQPLSPCVTLQLKNASLMHDLLLDNPSLQIPA